MTLCQLALNSALEWHENRPVRIKGKSGNLYLATSSTWGKKWELVSHVFKYPLLLLDQIHRTS